MRMRGHRLDGPIRGRPVDGPYVCRRFQFNSNLKKFSYRMRPLYPGHSRAHVAKVRAPCQLQRQPRIFRKVMLRRIPASMEVESESSGALFERLAEQIDAPNHDRQRFRDSFAAAALSGGMIRIHCWHPGSEKDEPEHSIVARPGREGKFSLENKTRLVFFLSRRRFHAAAQNLELIQALFRLLRVRTGRSRIDALLVCLCCSRRDDVNLFASLLLRIDLRR
jgi:hypothetical protein